jgi:hypothetical protein
VLSTRSSPLPEFLGADLTDASATTPRPVDVCGLRRKGRHLVAELWEWRWGAEGFEEIAAELRAATCSLLDGPQGLAAPGRSMRACERLSAAAGKTPDERAKIVPGRPFAGFVRTSLDVFGALAALGLEISPPRVGGGVGEAYPAYLWRLLAPGLAKKTTALGLAQRSALLEAAGVRLEVASASHDQLDAVICALVAAAACGAVRGLTGRTLGDPLSRRADGALEEGPMVVVEIGGELRERLRRASRVSHG